MTNQQKIKNRFKKSLHFEGGGGGVKANLEKVYILNFLTLSSEQCSDVWALSRLKPTFLWKGQFKLICHARVPKSNRLNIFYVQITQDFFSDVKFVEGIFFKPSEIGILGLTWRVTLLSRCNLKTLRLTITFLKICVHPLVKNLKMFN